MPRGVNKVLLIGFLGADPEIRALPSGSSVANFSVATSEKIRGRDGAPDRTQTEWHRVAAFGRVVDIVQQCNLQKGSQVYVEGSLRTRKWQDKAGQDRWSTEIIVKELHVIGAGEPPDRPQDDIPW